MLFCSIYSIENFLEREALGMAFPVESCYFDQLALILSEEQDKAGRKTLSSNHSLKSKLGGLVGSSSKLTCFLAHIRCIFLM